MRRWFSAIACILGLLVPAPAWAGGFRVGVSVELRQDVLGRRYGGFVLLELPLDRLFSPALRQAPPGPPPAEGVPGAPPAPEPTTSASAPLAPKPPAAAPERALPLPRALVLGTLRAALAARGRAVSSEELDGLATRARASAALPELSLRATRSTDQTLRLAPEGEVYQYTQTGGADLLLEARATWKLDRLVFADEELRVEQLRAERARANERVLSDVIKGLAAWQKARALLASAELEPAARVLREIELFEAELVLDLLTDGWFGRRVASRAPAATPAP